MLTHRATTQPHPFRHQPGMSNPRRWLITDEGLASDTAVSSARFRWADLHRLTVWPQAYLLHLGNGVLIDIPREPLSEEDASALRDHLTGLGLLTA